LKLKPTYQELEQQVEVAEALVVELRVVLQRMVSMSEYDQDDAHRLRHQAQLALAKTPTDMGAELARLQEVEQVLKAAIFADDTRRDTLHNRVTELEAELDRLKEGIKRAEVTMVVDGNDMIDWGWYRHETRNTKRTHNTHINELEG